MRKKYTFFLLLPAIIFCGCRTESYFLSPFNANNHPYYTKPLVSDTVHSAIYADGALGINAANYQGRDGVFSLRLAAHRSHTFQHLQIYYGASFTGGAYHVKPYDDVDPNNDYYDLVKPDAINKHAGNNYFTGLTWDGGMNFVIPIRKRHEWRVLGIETSMGKEWGDYYKFRKDLPDSSASVIVRSDRYGSIGLTTEMAFKLSRGGAVGFKFALGTSFYRTVNLHPENNLSDRFFRPAYFSATLQFTENRYTGFSQINFGQFAYGVQFGLNYKLSRR